MPHERHMCMLLPIVMPYIKHAHLGSHKRVRLEGRTTPIWSFRCDFAYSITMGCAGFRLSFGIIIFLQLLNRKQSLLNAVFALNFTIHATY